MGLWSDIAGIGAGIAGFAAAPFTGGLSIPAGLSAAGAIIGAGAVGDAADKQADATSQSLALQKTMYDTTRADLAPYASTGTAALGNLRQLTGLPAMAPAGAAGGLGQVASAVAPVLGAKVPPPGTPSVGQAVPRNSSSGFVTMVGPDGSTNQVDPAHVAYYQKLGAQVQNASGFAPTGGGAV